jgi:hypothetical protein
MKNHSQQIISRQGSADECSELSICPADIHKQGNIYSNRATGFPAT